MLSGWISEKLPDSGIGKAGADFDRKYPGHKPTTRLVHYVGLKITTDSADNDLDRSTISLSTTVEVTTCHRKILKLIEHDIRSHRSDANIT